MLPLRERQRLLVRLLTEPELLDPDCPSNSLTESDREYLDTLEVPAVRRAARNLVAKRWEPLVDLLPDLLNRLGDRTCEAWQEYCRLHPSAHPPIWEAERFAAWVGTTESWGAEVAAMGNREATRLRVRFSEDPPDWKSNRDELTLHHRVSLSHRAALWGPESEQPLMLARIPGTLQVRELTLNSIAAALLRQCDGEHTLGDLVRALAVERHLTGGERRRLEQDVLQFFNLLASSGWVTTAAGGPGSPAVP